MNELEKEPVISLIFDAFGTILRIRKKTNPFKSLIRIGVENGRESKISDSRIIMENPVDISAAADLLNINLLRRQLKGINKKLEEEINSIEPYPDAIEAIEKLKEFGLKIAVCSNLASPYASAIKRFFPGLDVYAYSFELGMTKPNQQIYRHCCDKLGSTPSQTAMIGDSIRCDRDGPRQIGISGYFLSRNDSQGDFSNLVDYAKSISDSRR